ncbi:MAG: hypothetical protein CW716_00340 [Candidatus Bathyarchaeum sp.]|nr:MAG: hypothetical protein CW716_00340 [Candidatus Bathyarchaeum sp.]
MSEFSEEVLKQAFLRANARCQCEREGHGHGSFTCFRQILWEKRGNKTERSGWEARYFVSPEKGGKPTVENCEILCWECYSKTV